MFRYEEALGEQIVSQILLLLGFSSDGQQFNRKHVKERWFVVRSKTWDKENKLLVSFQFLISEFQFLVGIQNFFFIPSSWSDKKHTFSFHYKASSVPSFLYFWKKVVLQHYWVLCFFVSKDDDSVIEVSLKLALACAHQDKWVKLILTR